MAHSRSVVVGCGAYLPETVVTNTDLAERGIETSDEWIVQRTGIRQRHIARADETTSVLGTRAAMAARSRGSASSPMSASPRSLAGCAPGWAGSSPRSRPA